MTTNDEKKEKKRWRWGQRRMSKMIVGDEEEGVEKGNGKRERICFLYIYKYAKPSSRSAKSLCCRPPLFPSSVFFFVFLLISPLVSWCCFLPPPPPPPLHHPASQRKNHAIKSLEMILVLVLPPRVPPPRMMISGNPPGNLEDRWLCVLGQDCWGGWSGGLGKGS